MFLVGFILFLIGFLGIITLSIIISCRHNCNWITVKFNGTECLAFVSGLLFILAGTIVEIISYLF